MCIFFSSPLFYNYYSLHMLEQAICFVCSTTTFVWPASSGSVRNKSLRTCVGCGSVLCWQTPSVSVLVWGRSNSKRILCRFRSTWAIAIMVPTTENLAKSGNAYQMFPCFTKIGRPGEAEQWSSISTEAHLKKAPQTQHLLNRVLVQDLGLVWALDLSAQEPKLGWDKVTATDTFLPSVFWIKSSLWIL